jgi:hypothetical protein
VVRRAQAGGERGAPQDGRAWLTVRVWAAPHTWGTVLRLGATRCALESVLVWQLLLPWLGPSEWAAAPLVSRAGSAAFAGAADVPDAGARAFRTWGWLEPPPGRSHREEVALRERARRAMAASWEWFCLTSPPGLRGSLRAGAGAGELAALERQLRLRLPSQLRASLELHDGQEAGEAPSVLGFFLSAREIAETVAALPDCFREDSGAAFCCLPVLQLRPNYDEFVVIALATEALHRTRGFLHAGALAVRLDRSLASFLLVG